MIASLSLMSTTILELHGHGTVIGINGNIVGTAASRSWQTHKGLHRLLVECDRYSLVQCLALGGASMNTTWSNAARHTVCWGHNRGHN